MSVRPNPWDIVTCPVCHGEGIHDMRDSDAILAEHGIPFQPLGVIACDDCGGSGQMQYWLARDIQARAAATVDQVLAQLAHEERLAEP